jgi:hypothetical protein
MTSQFSQSGASAPLMFFDYGISSRKREPMLLAFLDKRLATPVINIG